MKILLVGEYSRLHNSLKEGLVTLGHQVCIISTGDYFKNFPSDIKLERKFNSGFSKKIKVGLFILLGIDITSISIKNQFFKQEDNLKGFDIVQIINESPFGIDPDYEKQIITFLKNNNQKLFLLSCGTDHTNVQYSYDKKLDYSTLTPLFNNEVSENKFSHILKYLQPKFKSLHNFIYKNINGVIASDIDYHLPLKEHPNYLGMIPNPINTDSLIVSENDSEPKINIFLGINRNNYHTKGIRYFEEALTIIRKKYSDKIEIKIVENLPYSEYITTYNKAHIVLDQALSYDQGYNALEAMAKGKVVFTGAEKEFEEYYNLDKPVAINALPDTQDIVKKLEDLILHPEKITEIGNNAKAFILEHHHYKMVAEKYLNAWENA